LAKEVFQLLNAIITSHIPHAKKGNFHE
jgi:hypothetical protein